MMMPSSKIVSLTALLLAARATDPAECKDADLVMSYTCERAAFLLGCDGTVYGATPEDPTSLVHIECPVTCNTCPTVAPTPGPTVSPTPPTESPTLAPTGSPTPCADTQDTVMGYTCERAAFLLGCEGTVYGATPEDPTSKVKLHCPDTCGLCPTDAPTRSPTVSPTPPTEAPTSAPTSTPTYCRDSALVMGYTCAKAVFLLSCDGTVYGATPADPTSVVRAECPITCGDCPPMDFCHIDDVTCDEHPDHMDCKEFVCEPKSGSCHEAVKADGSLCDDENPLTMYDSCAAGVCVGIDLCQGVTCNAVDQCHNAGQCNPATGTCTVPQKPDNTPCDDNKAWTQDDVCTAGICAGTGQDICATCVSSNPCEVSTCATDGLSCEVTNVPNGDPCDVGDSTGTCEEGVCSAAPAEAPTQPPSDGTPLGNDPEPKSSGSMPMIIGAAAGGAVLLIAMIVTIMMCKKRKAQKEVEDYLRKASRGSTWRGLPANGGCCGSKKPPASPSVVDMGQDRTGKSREETLRNMWNTAPGDTDRTTARAAATQGEERL